MKKKDLTTEQIDYLFDFTRQKRVRYYDVQVEIVDHLASAIEEKQREQPDLAFQAALEQVYSGFGIFGFAKVVQAREQAVEKRGIREIGRFFRSLLHPDRLWIPVALLIGLHLLFRLFPQEQFDTYVLVTAFLFYLPLVVAAIRVVRRFRQREGKSFLLLQAPLSMAVGVGSALYGAIFSWINLLSMEVPYSNGLLWAAAGILTITLLYGYAAVVYLPSRAEAMLREQFPEYAA